MSLGSQKLAKWGLELSPDETCPEDQFSLFLQSSPLVPQSHDEGQHWDEFFKNVNNIHAYFQSDCENAVV